MVQESSNSKWKPIEGQIMTRWATKVNPDVPLPEYPRPQMVRKEWLNLNGLWNYKITSSSETAVNDYDGKILVPFAVESALSGVKRKVNEKQAIWYQKIFTIPVEWKDKRILLNFGAVDWFCRVIINGKSVGEHTGGYVPFTFDIADFVNFDGENEIIVKVTDPTDKQGYPRGKQSLKPYGIWYTSVTGIWQTVWLEPVPEIYIESLKMMPDIDNDNLNLIINIDNSTENEKIKITIKDEGKHIVELVEDFKDSYTIKIPNQKLWTPNTPFLYELIISIETSNDEVESYFGMRKIDVKEDKIGT